MLIGKPIYQKYTKLPKAQSRTILLSSWVIGGMPAGLCFREDTNKLTNNNSEFLPHFFNKQDKKREFDFKATEWQKGVRKQLYNCEFNPFIYAEANEIPTATLNTTSNSSYNSTHGGIGCSCGGGCPSYDRARSYNKTRPKKDPMSAREAASKRASKSSTVHHGGRRYKANVSRKANFGKISRSMGASPRGISS